MRSLPSDTGGENGPDSVKTKADIMKYLKDSFTYIHKAASTIDTEQYAHSDQSPRSVKAR